MTNKQITHDKDFLILCAIAGVKPTVRQASKFRNGKGSAYNASR